MIKKAVLKVLGALLIISALVVFLVPSEPTDADTASTTDFQLNGTTLVKYVGTAITVSIPDTVKVIGEEAFLDNAAVYSVVIPDSVEEISYAAFSGCSNLTSVKIPDSVETIGTAAFCNCSSLNEVTIGSGLRKLGTGVFTGCTSLSDVKFKTDRFVCDNGVILDDEKDKLYQVLPGKNNAAYSMPNTVTQIAPYAFYGCSSLNSVTLSPYLEEITAYAFSNCNGLKSVMIPYSVNNIDAKAFENCVNLSDVEITESVSFIHDTAFDGCPRLNIEAPTFSYAYKWFQKQDRSDVSVIDSEDNIYTGDTGVSASDISNNDNTTGTNDNSDSKQPHETSPKDLEDVMDFYVSSEGLIGETIVVGRKAVVFINNTKQTVVNGNRVITDYSDYVPETVTDQMTEDTNGKGANIPKFAIIGDKIANKAFYGEYEMTSYDIPGEVKAIGDFAFSRSGLTSVIIPEGVTDIGYGAFYHCDDLSEVSIPQSVTNIEPAAFSKTKYLDNWKRFGSGDYLIVGDGILLAYRGADSKIKIPEGIKQIGPEAFTGHMGITDVSLPDSVVRICENAFSDCSNLTSVTGGMNLSVIEDRAFDGCPIETVRIVDSVSEIGVGAFDLNNTVAVDENKAVVFLGNALPKVSINATSTRLANEEYRKDALSGVKVAIVNNENIVTEGTILDRNMLGFSGLICTIVSENDDYHNGTLKIVGCTLTKEEAEQFVIPNTMIIFGKGYNFDEAELSSILSAAREGGFEDSEDREINPARFSGSDKTYDLNIVFDNNADSSIKDAYKRVYGEDAPGNLTTFDIKVSEPDNGVELTKFGQQMLLVPLKLPTKVPMNNIHVICVDDNHQLEDLSYKMVDMDGTLAVSFEISHTGKYGIYSYNSGAPVSQEGLDETPDTGVDDVSLPKLLLSIGLFSAGLALLLYKKR